MKAENEKQNSGLSCLSYGPLSRPDQPSQELETHTASSWGHWAVQPEYDVW